LRVPRHLYSRGGARSGAGLFGGRAGPILGALAGIATGGVGWGWFEAGWARLEKLDVALPGLPEELRGLRIAHLSDFHLGGPGRGRHAVERAVAWVEEQQPDLTLISGDLLARASGEAQLRALIARLPNCFTILGNHDLAISRDPFSERTALSELDPATLLSDEGVTIDLRGKRVYIAGADPRSRWAKTRRQAAYLAVPREDADLRILIAHYPYLVDELPPGAFDLVVAGHMHDGQICIPYPGGKVRLAHLGAPYNRGLYRRPGGVLHVSSGLGTTFVPFRFAARPEATELVLQPE
jgi:predicted MPP superfamily phosphohydrolase